MSKSGKDNVMSAVRHAINAIGAILISHGTMEADLVNSAAGGVLAIVALVWSWDTNKRTRN